MKLLLLHLIALTASLSTACAQVPGNAPFVVPATNQIPDRVATGLIAIPIYNFAIHNVAFSPDSGMLATGNGAGQVRLWNTKTGKLEKSIQAHTNWAFSIAWSKDGKFLVTGGGDNLVKRYDGTNPDQPLKTLRGHTEDVHAIAISPDARHIFSAGDDRRIIDWNAETGTESRAWPGHTRQIPTLALSPDGQLLASGSRDNSIRLWKPRTGQLHDTLIGHTEDVMSVRFSPDGALLASASYDKTVRLWDVKTGKALHIYKGHTNRVFSVAFSPDGTHLASAGDANVIIWDVPGRKFVRSISLGGAILTSNGKVSEVLSSVAYSPNGQSLAVSSTTGTTFLLSPENGHLIHKFIDTTEPAKQ